jgi:hypothetical protein
VSLYGGGRDPQHFRSVLNSEAGEETKLNNVALLRTEVRQVVQSVVQGEEIDVFSFATDKSLGKS